MAFKWGLTVMSSSKPNSSAAMDLLATMEAFDKYNNLRDEIFQHHVEESAVVLNTEVDPVLITICAKSGTPLIVRVSVSGLVDDPLLHDPVLCDREAVPNLNHGYQAGRRQDSVMKTVVMCGVSPLWTMYLLSL
jgi:hypothetical protein